MLLRKPFGDIAQLARACDWQSQGQGFDSPYLHAPSGCATGVKGGFFIYAQLGERPDAIGKVRGSIPLISTRPPDAPQV